MLKTPFQEIPKNYALCLRDDCLRGATCLHHLTYEFLMKRYVYLRVISPDRCVPDASCPYYRDSAPVLYARGFKGMQSQMFPEQYQKFREILSNRLNPNRFYQWRRGEFPLSPEEQNLILQALHLVGVTENLPFDHYEKGLCW